MVCMAAPNLSSHICRSTCYERLEQNTAWKVFAIFHVWLQLSCVQPILRFLPLLFLPIQTNFMTNFKSPPCSLLWFAFLQLEVISSSLDFPHAFSLTVVWNLLYSMLLENKLLYSRVYSGRILGRKVLESDISELKILVFSLVGLRQVTIAYCTVTFSLEKRR